MGLRTNTGYTVPEGMVLVITDIKWKVQVMKTKRAPALAAMLTASIAVLTVGIVGETHSARPDSKAQPGSSEALLLLSATPTPTPEYYPDYTVLPSDTDGQPGDSDCPNPGIGCNGHWGDSATDKPHLFYLPPSKEAGRLLVFFNGGHGTPNLELPIYGFAASRGYHVIGLSYNTASDEARINACDNDAERLSCYRDFMLEVLRGTDNCEHQTCSGLNIDQHTQDAALNRLVKALKWAECEKGDGWGEYLTDDGDVDWTKVNIAGFSNGSSYAALLGTLFPSVGRVTLFSGPNDGDGSSATNWMPADYIQGIAGFTDTRYYGLVHKLNKAEDEGNTSTLYRVTKGWLEFGMGQPVNSSRFDFDPVPGQIPNFGNAHMLISTNPTTDYLEAHASVVQGRECSTYGDDENGKYDCLEYEGEWIGYEPAWRCVLGSGSELQNGAPNAEAGSNQTVECEAGGAYVTLDGSFSSDPDCENLSYTWTGPFGVVTGQKPQVFMPVGTSTVTLVVSDGWPTSTSTDTTTITVQDSLAPSLQLTLTPTELRPANHQLVWINATVKASDSCGPPPLVVLTSITSNQPDNGTGDGDTASDIQEAALGTFDLSFMLRAERAGDDRGERTYTITYTATDASGNCTQASAIVHVPHSLR